MNAPEHDSIICWRGTTVPSFRHIDFYVYTLHFHQGLDHGSQAATRHYTGMTGALNARLALHHTPYSGARLMAIACERRVTWELAQLIPCETSQEAHELERRLKWHSATRRCPVCCSKQKDVLVRWREGHWPISIYTRVGKCQPMKKNGSLYFD